MNTFTILLGGSLKPTARLRQQIAGSRVIAADGGMVHAKTLSLEPELWIGDFDSASASLQAEYAHIPQARFPVAKDKTDGELALEAALGRGATRLLLLGAMGGQTDHALAHLLLSIRLAKAGLEVLLSSGLEEGYPLLPGAMGLELPPGSTFSLLPFSNLKNLSIQGAQWPLEGIDVQLGDTLTLSNVALGAVQIQLGSGYGVAVAYPATM